MLTPEINTKQKGHILYCKNIIIIIAEKGHQGKEMVMNVEAVVSDVAGNV